MRKYALIFILTLSDLIYFQRIQACSGFYIAKDSVVWACKNTDATDWKSKIWFTPATESTFGYVSFGFEYHICAMA